MHTDRHLKQPLRKRKCSILDESIYTKYLKNCTVEYTDTPIHIELIKYQTNIITVQNITIPSIYKEKDINNVYDLLFIYKKKSLYINSKNLKKILPSYRSLLQCIYNTFKNNDKEITHKKTEIILENSIQIIIDLLMTELLYDEDQIYSIYIIYIFSTLNSIKYSTIILQLAPMIVQYIRYPIINHELTWYIIYIIGNISIEYNNMIVLMEQGTIYLISKLLSNILGQYTSSLISSNIYSTYSIIIKTSFWFLYNFLFFIKEESQYKIHLYYDILQRTIQFISIYAFSLQDIHLYNNKTILNESVYTECLWFIYIFIENLPKYILINNLNISVYIHKLQKRCIISFLKIFCIYIYHWNLFYIERVHTQNDSTLIHHVNILAVLRSMQALLLSSCDINIANDNNITNDNSNNNNSNIIDDTCKQLYNSICIECTIEFTNTSLATTTNSTKEYLILPPMINSLSNMYILDTNNSCSSCKIITIETAMTISYSIQYTSLYYIEKYLENILKNISINLTIHDDNELIQSSQYLLLVIVYCSTYTINTTIEPLQYALYSSGSGSCTINTINNLIHHIPDENIFILYKLITPYINTTINDIVYQYIISPQFTNVLIKLLQSTILPNTTIYLLLRIITFIIHLLIDKNTSPTPILLHLLISFLKQYNLITIDKSYSTQSLCQYLLQVIPYFNTK